jgi:hypothetical protein
MGRDKWKAEAKQNESGSYEWHWVAAARAGPIFCLIYFPLASYSPLEGSGKGAFPFPHQP